MKSKGWSSSVECPATGTQYALQLPIGTSQFLARCSDLSATWRWSFQAGAVADGKGIPIAAGEAAAIDWSHAPLGETQPIYVAVDTADVSIEFGGSITVTR